MDERVIGIKEGKEEMQTKYKNLKVRIWYHHQFLDILFNGEIVCLVFQWGVERGNYYNMR